MSLFTVIFAILWWSGTDPTIPLRCAWDCFAAPFHPAHFRGILSNMPLLLSPFPFNPTRMFPTFNPVKNLTYYILTTFSIVRGSGGKKRNCSLHSPLRFCYVFYTWVCAISPGNGSKAQGHHPQTFQPVELQCLHVHQSQCSTPSAGSL